jgi:polar amino acid transport system substrate-binding protein
LCVLVTQSLAYGTEKKPLVFARIVDSPHTELGMRILGEAYGRLGVKVEFRLMPGARALRSSDNGITDGELFRVNGMAAKYGNLIQVPIHIGRTDFVAFTRRQVVPFAGYDSLKPLRLAFRRGMKIVENGTADMERYMVSDPIQAFHMLDRGRVDVVIENRLAGLKTLRDLGIRKVAVLEPPLHDEPLYHYVHRSHADLVPKLTVVLEEMYRDGEIRRFETETVEALTN